MMAFQAELRGMQIKVSVDKRSGVVERTGVPQLRVLCDEERLHALLGPRVAQLAFGPMQRDGSFGYTSLQPRIVFGAHEVWVDDVIEIVSVPTVTKIVPADQPYNVVVQVSLPFLWDTYRKSGHQLISLTGTVVSVQAEPRQPDLPGVAAASAQE